MYITWKGITSDSLSVVVNSMPFVSPEERIDMSESEGRDGAEITGLGLRPYIIPCKMTLLPGSDLDTVRAWLTGSSTLLRSDDPLKYQLARISSKIDWRQAYSTREIQVEFIIKDPFRYLLSESDVTKTVFPATYVNAGTLISKPLLKVSGTGTVVFVVNGTTLTYVFDTAYVYIDCDRMSAFYSVLDDKCGNLTLSPDDYPTFAVGSNAISITSGTISEIVITPRTRFI